MGGIAKASAPGLGVAQSWQSVAYTMGTVRQNTTGRAIAVSFLVTPNMTWAGRAVVLEVGTANPPTIRAAEERTSSGGAANAEAANLQAIVPHGHYYRVREPSGGAPEWNISNLWELRP